VSDPFAGIEGQDEPLAVLRRAIAEDRVASAYLFEGPSGVGKERTARALATALIAKDERGVTRLRDGTHPDLRVFRPRDEGARNIKVEVLREEVLPYAEFAPFETDRAMLLFPEADVSFPETHPAGANAILKTLEEPKPGVTFVLLAERPERLLPTIRSRAQALRFRRLGTATLEGILEAEGVAEADRGPAIALADGRADRALALGEADDDGRSLGRRLYEMALAVDDALSKAVPGTLTELAQRIAKADERGMILDTLMRFYRDVACAAAGMPDEALAFRHEAEEIRRRARRLSAGRASGRVAQIGKTLDELELNASAATALDALLYRMRRPREPQAIVPPRRMA